MQNLCTAINSATSTMLFSIWLWPNSWWIPACEWGIVLAIINYFGLCTYTNPYYASVHPYGKLI